MTQQYGSLDSFMTVLFWLLAVGTPLIVSPPELYTTFLFLFRFFRISSLLAAKGVQ